MFRNRLRKNLRRLMPWVNRCGLQAYRLYDSDIPEVRLIVERYGDNLVLSEYARRADKQEFDENSAKPAPDQNSFLSEVLAALSEECGIDKAHIFIKHRFRQRSQDTGQYERLGSSAPASAASFKRSHEILINEGGHRFWINLGDYVDTGLFLDHRETRALVAKHAAGKRVLNLFGYTGSFTVYAAGGGAESSVTVDLSSTYLNWAERNFAENRLDRRRHRLLRADVLELLRSPRAMQAALAQDRPVFDLIVLDPPTFSNSKRMQGTLDVTRDHPRLISQALGFLSNTPESMLLFSCNQRNFRLRAEELCADPSALSIADITAETLPRDFHDPRTRCCYLITRRAPSNI